MSYRILIVDDQPDWCTEFQALFHQMRYEADAVTTTQEAKNHLRDRAYAVLVLDIQLKDSSYLPFQTLCEFVRQEFPSIPIVATSGRQIDTDFMWRLRDLGVAGFFAKSNVLFDDLRHLIDALIIGGDTDLPIPNQVLGDIPKSFNIQNVNIFLESSQQINRSGGVELCSGGDISVGGSVVGRDNIDPDSK